MYEEFPKRPIDWKTIIIRSGISFIVLLLIVLTILATFRANAPLSKEELEFSDNLSTIEIASENYFVEKKLPTNTNETVKVSIETLNDLNLIEKFSFDLKNCDIKESYSTITKISNTKYTLRTQLSCNDEENFYIKTITLNSDNA